jgi:hypothetical protein
MPQFTYLAELVDPRPHDAGRHSYQGMPLLPVSYECDWMTSDEALQGAVNTEMWSLVNTKVSGRSGDSFLLPAVGM